MPTPARRRRRGPRVPKCVLPNGHGSVVQSGQATSHFDEFVSNCDAWARLAAGRVAVDQEEQKVVISVCPCENCACQASEKGSFI